jgi:thymidylate kinase
MTSFDAPSPRRPTAGSSRPTGVTVALVGPDGAGKSTVARMVVEQLPFRAGYLYMGVNLDASTVMLPTTRLALAMKRHRGGGSNMTARSKAGHRGPLGTARALIRMLNWVAEEIYRGTIAARMRRRGAVVVSDRDFFCDYYASAIGGSPASRPLDARVHGFVLRRLYRKPDFTIMLDAPPELLLARKGEDTLEGLTRRRQEYLDLESVLPAFVVVDATRPLELVAADVVARIVAFVGIVEESAAAPSEPPPPDTAGHLVEPPPAVPLPDPLASEPAAAVGS